MFSCVLGEEKQDIDKMLSQFGVKMKAANYKKDIKPLLTDVCSAIFGKASGLTQMLVQHIPSSKSGAKTKVEHLYSGPPVCNSIIVSGLPSGEPVICSYLSATIPTLNVENLWHVPLLWGAR